jgi:hypothetical protein
MSCSVALDVGASLQCLRSARKRDTKQGLLLWRPADIVGVDAAAEHALDILSAHIATGAALHLHHLTRRCVRHCATFTERKVRRVQGGYCCAMKLIPQMCLHCDAPILCARHKPTHLTYAPITAPQPPHARTARQTQGCTLPCSCSNAASRKVLARNACAHVMLHVQSQGFVRVLTSANRIETLLSSVVMRSCKALQRAATYARLSRARPHHSRRSRRGPVEAFRRTML